MIPFGLVGYKFLATVIAVVHYAVIMSFNMFLENVTVRERFWTVITFEGTFFRKRIDPERSIDEFNERLTKFENIIVTIFI